MKRIMYVEVKSHGLSGAGRIGWVELTRTARSYRYQGKLLIKVRGYKYNCIDAETGERYWVSGPRADGRDRLYPGFVAIDADAQQAYWTEVRKQPQNVASERYRS